MSAAPYSSGAGPPLRSPQEFASRAPPPSYPSQASQASASATASSAAGRTRSGTSTSNASLATATNDSERQPLLVRRTFSHDLEPDPIYSCTTNPHTHLPVYTNIHRIRRDIVSVVEDYLSPEQLHDMRINLSVVRPLVDKLYELDDISIS